MATLTRWEPLGVELPAWMTRLFDEGPLDGLLDKPLLRIEEFLEDDTLVVRAELPGVDVDKDVDISVHDGLLHIKGARIEEAEKKGKTFYRSEFRYGAFERTMALPPGATVDDVKATYENGVLEIRIPTPSGATTKHRVPVQRVS